MSKLVVWLSLLHYIHLVFKSVILVPYKEFESFPSFPCALEQFKYHWGYLFYERLLEFPYKITGA